MYGGTSDVYAVMTKYGGDTCRKTFTRDDNYRQHVRKDHPDETWVNRSGQGRQGFEPSHNVPARLVVYSFATSKTVRVEGESGVVCECTKFWTPQTYRERFGSGNNAILDRSPDAESNSARSRWAVDAGTWRELARNLSSFYEMVTSLHEWCGSDPELEVDNSVLHISNLQGRGSSISSSSRRHVGQFDHRRKFEVDHRTHVVRRRIPDSLVHISATYLHIFGGNRPYERTQMILTASTRPPTYAISTPSLPIIEKLRIKKRVRPPSKGARLLPASHWCSGLVSVYGVVHQEALPVFCTSTNRMNDEVAGLQTLVWWVTWADDHIAVAVSKKRRLFGFAQPSNSTPGLSLPPGTSQARAGDFASVSEPSGMASAGKLARMRRLFHRSKRGTPATIASEVADREISGGVEEQREQLQAAPPQGVRCRDWYQCWGSR
ncbi:hypothetical protein EV401DRAFT_1891420 [Pisolithus croceorrhizus]|nr:hypothetical protein EV401DRAFT_1891420 [Pisolithus croceorrhizus]